MKLYPIGLYSHGWMCSCLCTHSKNWEPCGSIIRIRNYHVPSLIRGPNRCYNSLVDYIVIIARIHDNISEHEGERVTEQVYQWHANVIGSCDRVTLGIDCGRRGEDSIGNLEKGNVFIVNCQLNTLKPTPRHYAHQFKNYILYIVIYAVFYLHQNM